jgi:hypothetical protein
MPEFLTILHECKDFKTWKSVYDADAANRKAADLTELMLVQDSANANRVALLFGVSDLAKAKAMVASDGLREAMQKAGVIGAPTVHFRRGTFAQKTAANYLTLNCKVSGFDTFKKGYAMDKADRQAASLTDLGLMQNIDDANDLLLLWSVGDVAKVTTFLKSPKLAEHQVKNAGLIGEPVARFWVK